jgi:hypothetical protein
MGLWVYGFIAKRVVNFVRYESRKIKSSIFLIFRGSSKNNDPPRFDFAQHKAGGLFFGIINYELSRPGF